MSQHDMNIANATFPTVRADINSALGALVTLSGGAAAPGTTFAHQLWADETNNVIWQRDEANAAWNLFSAFDYAHKTKTATYTIALEDFNRCVEATSGTWDLVLPAVATAGSGFRFRAKNSGTGVMSLNPDASETIDACLTIDVGQGEDFWVYCDGTKWTTNRNFLGKTNAQSGTTYTVVKADHNRLTSFNNASPVAVTLPQASATTFPSWWRGHFVNIGNGTVTITPTTSTIDLLSSITLQKGEGVTIVSDGTNYNTIGRANSLDNLLGSTRGMVPYRGASGWTGLAVGTAGQSLQTGGAGADPAWGSKNVVQRVDATPYTANADLSPNIPWDDTKPQNTEGTQILTLTITPKSTSSKIALRAQGGASVASGSPDNFIMAIFRSGSADAIAAQGVSVPTTLGQVRAQMIEVLDSPATTSAVTYTVRVGPDSGVLRMNGSNSARRLGGVMMATLVAEEIAA